MQLVAGYGGRGGRGGRGGDSSPGLILGGVSQTSKEFQQHLANKGSSPRLILPGGRPAPGAQQQLIVADPESGGAAGILDSNDSVTTPTPPSRYRPPAGFMNEEVYEDETTKMQPGEMLSRLQARAGKWYKLAKMITSLQKQNYDSSAISETTGIPPVEQNRRVRHACMHCACMQQSQMRGTHGPSSMHHHHAWALGTEQPASAVSLCH